jgi:chromosome segregation ATPase
MLTFRTKAIAIAAAGVLGIGLTAHGFNSMRTQMSDRITALEHELQALRAQDGAKIQEVSSDLDYMAQRMDVTRHDLEEARKAAETLKQQNQQADQKLRNEIASRSRLINQYREEASSRLDAVQKDTSTKFGTVNGEVQNVRMDLDATRNDLAASRKEMTDVRDLIAHNSGELAALRRRGERDYLEFDIRKTKNSQRIGDIKLQLKKTDTKKQKFDAVLFVDDGKMEEKGQSANEPVTFFVGRDRLRYELVVNYVDKDRIRGYLSTPKDKAMSAEGPSFRTQQ